MTDDLRAEIARLSVEGERLKAEDADFQERYQQHLQKQRSADGLVFKTYEPRQPQPRAVADLSPECEARWNAWANRLIKTAIDKLVEDELRHFARELGAKTGKLEKQINELRQQIENFRLPVLEGWQPRHYLKGSIVVSGGSVHQAREDTSFHPGHHTWNCIVTCGENGQDGRDADGQRRGVVDLPQWPARKSDVA